MGNYRTWAQNADANPLSAQLAERDAEIAALREQVDDLSTVGIDEVAMSKGRKNYAAIITARQKDGKVRILAVLPDRKKRL